MDHLKKWWAAHLTIVATVVAFLTPSVNAWVGQHPGWAIIMGAAWGYILHLLPSPVKQ